MNVPPAVRILAVETAEAFRVRVGMGVESPFVVVLKVVPLVVVDMVEVGRLIEGMDEMRDTERRIETGMKVHWVLYGM
jgi:hypothetical protein